MIYGLVLCGGYSTRMGTDKGTILKNGKTWASIVYEKLIPFSDKVLVSVRQSQLNLYQTYFEKEILIPDNTSIQGPFAGIISAHNSQKNADWLVLPCDMIDFDLDYLKKLTEEYLSKKNKIYAFQNFDKIEPFPCIFTKSIFTKIQIQQNVGVQHIIKTSNSNLIQIKSSLETFSSYNNSVPNE